MACFQSVFHLRIQLLKLFDRDIIDLREPPQRLSRLHIVQVIILSADFCDVLGTLRRCLGIQVTRKRPKKQKEKQEKKQSIFHYHIHFQYYSHSMVAGGFDEMS